MWFCARFQAIRGGLGGSRQQLLDGSSLPTARAKGGSLGGLCFHISAADDSFCSYIAAFLRERWALLLCTMIRFLSYATLQNKLLGDRAL